MPRMTKGDHVIDTNLPSERVELLGQGYSEETAEELSARTVPELKAELKSAGLPTDGNKTELVERLADPAPVDGKPAGKTAKS